MRVLSFGEILWDVYADKKYLGGAPLNFAAHLARHGEDVYMLSALGKDNLGKEALTQLKKWGIFTGHVSLSAEKQTGRCLVTLDENSVPDYNLLQDVAYDYINCKDVPHGFDVLYFGTLALRSKNNFYQLNKLIENNNFNDIFVDINIRPPFYTEKSVNFSIEKATILKISLEELPVIIELLKFQLPIGYKEFAVQLSNLYNNLKCIIITLGSDGAYALDCINGKEYTCDAEKVTVKSTVGAGDSFSAAFLHKYINNIDVLSALKQASKVAGFVVSQYDAVPDYRIEDFA